MNVFRVAVYTILAFLAVALLSVGLGWIHDAERARSEQLRQSRFIARTLPATPSSGVAAEPLARV